MLMMLTGIGGAARLADAHDAGRYSGIWAGSSAS